MQTHFDGTVLSLPWVIPFVGMLLSIAVGPLLAPVFWMRHYGKVALFWAFAFLIPCAAIFGGHTALHVWLHAILLEYIPFIVLLAALFAVSGGIRIKGRFAGTPVSNTGILCAGAILAGWMGTTGAAMLFIRPMLRANAHRKYQVHSVVFFIFLVGNIGGALTPLGDPPLFLGFLKGVDFFWTARHLSSLMVLLCVLLLGIYFLIDSMLYRKEGSPVSAEAGDAQEKRGVEGTVNILLLLGIIGTVLMSGVWKPGVTWHILGIPLELQNIARDGILIVLAVASMFLTSKEIRERNDFSHEPIEEVAKLFFGIFVSMIPAIAILKAGEAGALAPLVSLVNEGGQPHDALYFWITGALSSFLDNAPSYLVFFNTAASTFAGTGADPAQTLMTTMASTLTAISAGAVFMGACTYIGNAPNFMVRSIAVHTGVKMPSFFGYMAWSVCLLLPLFGLLTLLFF